jgi:hypothetical protein
LSGEDFCGKSVRKKNETVLFLTTKGQIMDALDLDELQLGGRCAKVNRPLAELNFLVMQAEQEKEKRRLVIATLEALVGSDWDRSASQGDRGAIWEKEF